MKKTKKQKQKQQLPRMYYFKSKLNGAMLFIDLAKITVLETQQDAYKLHVEGAQHCYIVENENHFIDLIDLIDKAKSL